MITIQENKSMVYIQMTNMSTLLSVNIYKEKAVKIKIQEGIIQDVQRYAGIWKRLCKSINNIQTFHDKKPVFILATYGVNHTKKLIQEVKNSDLHGIL